MDRHFTVSIYIVYKDKVLLHLHKKAKKILPIGGHIEVNELPEEERQKTNRRHIINIFYNIINGI